MTTQCLCIQWQRCMLITYTHTNPFNGPFSGTTRVSGYEKGKPIWILLKQETVSGSGISWAICKSASLSRQITMPVLHHSKFFYRPDAFLLPNQQRQSTEGKCMLINLYEMQKAISRCCCQLASLLCTGNRTMITALKGNTTYYIVTN